MDHRVCIIYNLQHLHTVVCERPEFLFSTWHPHTTYNLVHFRVRSPSLNGLPKLPKLKILEFMILRADVLYRLMPTAPMFGTLFTITGCHLTRERYPSLTRVVIAVNLDQSGIRKQFYVPVAADKIKFQTPDGIDVEIRHARSGTQPLEEVFYEQTNEQLKQIALSTQTTIQGKMQCCFCCLHTCHDGCRGDISNRCKGCKLLDVVDTCTCLC